MKRFITFIAAASGIVAVAVALRQLTMEFGPVDIKDVIRDSDPGRK